MIYCKSKKFNSIYGKKDFSFIYNCGIKYYMIKSFLRSLSVAMVIVGTMIGAGFASGREIVSFFGTRPNAFSALIAGALVMACSVLFLFVGRAIKSSNVGAANERMFGALRPIADIFMLFNSLITLGAMLAGMDSLGAEIYDLKPLWSLIAGILCAVTALKGLNGLVKVNCVFVPVMIAVIVAACVLTIEIPFHLESEAVLPLNIMLYVSMNMVLGSSVLTTVHHLSKREIVLSSFIAALVIGVLLLLFSGALNSTNSSYADMPSLVVALTGGGKIMYYCMIPIIALAIFTTMLAAFKSLYDYLNAYVHSPFFCSALVLLGGMIVANMGFSAVVDKLYPAIGVIGLIYITAAVVLLIKSPVKQRLKITPKVRKLKSFAIKKKSAQKSNHAKNRQPLNG